LCCIEYCACRPICQGKSATYFVMSGVLKLADKAKRALGAKSRTEAVHRALEEVVHTDHLKRWMLKYGGKLKFEGYPD